MVAILQQPEEVQTFRAKITREVTITQYAYVEVPAFNSAHAKDQMESLCDSAESLEIYAGPLRWHNDGIEETGAVVSDILEVSKV